MTKFATFVAVAGLTTILAGCGGGDKPSEPKAANGPDPKLQRAGVGTVAPNAKGGGATNTPPVTKD